MKCQQNLDTDTQVPGDTSGPLCPEVVAIAASTPVNGGNVVCDDFALTVGRGHSGTGGAVITGQGKVLE